MSWLENFQLWKLHTAADYLNTALFFLASFGIGTLAVHFHKISRNDSAAAKRVCKKLRAKGCRVWLDTVLRIQGQNYHADALCLDGNVLYVLRCFGWGTVIKASSGGAEWKLCHGTEQRVVPNPVLQMQGTLKALKQYLAGENNSELKVLPWVVFADNFSHPLISISGEAQAYVTTCQDLMKWRKKQSVTATGKQDTGRIIRSIQAILENSFR